MKSISLILLILFLIVPDAFSQERQKPERNIEFERGMEINVEKPERERMSVGSSERSDRERNTPTIETSKPPAKLTTTSALAIQRINNIIKNIAAMRNFLIAGQLANLFANPADVLASLAVSISTEEWIGLANAFKDLTTIQNGLIRNTIEEARREIDEQLMQHNREGKDGRQLRQELKFWENMDKALPATISSNQRISTVTDFQIFVSHNVIENGIKGMKFYPHFSISNALFSEGLVGIYFYKTDKAPLKDFNNNFRSANGNIATYGNFSPRFQNSSYNKNNEYKFGIFIPYNELHMPSGKHTIYYQITIFDYDRAVFSSNWYSFRLTKP